MSRVLSTWRTFAELGRISNVPTTFTNVLTGCAIGTFGLVQSAPREILWIRLITVWIAIASFYVAGMILNDVADAAIDAVERPQRPIPSGRMSHRRAGMIAAVLLLFGLAILATLSVAAVAMGSILVATIVLYDLIHTRVAASVILMGMCRGMVYAVGAWSVVPTPDWHVLGWLATTLTLYTIVFSIVARSETQSQLDQRRWLAVLLPFIAIAPVVALHPTQWPWVIVPLALAFGWSARGVGMVFATPPRTRDAVMTWLAEICLVDALYLALLDRPIWALIAIGCFGLTVMGQRRISGA